MTIEERFKKIELELNHLLKQRDQTAQLLNNIETGIMEKTGARKILIEILKEENGNNTKTDSTTSD